MDSTFWGICDIALARWEVPAAAIGMSHGGRVERSAFGCSVDARFRVASITKPVTATAAVRQLELDGPAPGWPGACVADLLAHLSGYDSELGDLTEFGDGDDALERLVAALPGCRRFLPAGEVWSYANTGYWLTGQLLALQAGLQYEDVIGALLAEVGLAATDFGEPDLSGTGPGVLDGAYPRGRRPSGGLVSTVPDLLRFGAWHLARPELAMMRTARGRPVGGVYGLGLAGERVGGVEVWGHAGSYGGFQSMLLLVPERDAVFVGLTNSGLGKQALREIEDAWFERLLGARRRIPETVSLDESVLAGFAGRYENTGSAGTVTVDGSRLVVELDSSVGLVVAPARAIGPARFEIVEGNSVRDRFDFPRPGLARFGARLSERVSPDV